ncbi:acyltransferase [Arthrobacter sp. ISL-69]|uniref:acyltransferase n=1 Tax=Arthrobacter sp. ISL-69 TaxID=2819113 RepID=UPI0037BFC7F2
MKRVFASLYEKVRGHSLEDSSLPTSVMIDFSSKKLGDLARGTIHQALYGNSSGLHFRGRRTSVSNPRYLRVGSGVVFGENVSINAFGSEGIHLGSSVTVGSGSDLLATAVIREPGVGISIGPGTSVGRSNVIWGQGGVVIGANCLLGPNVTVLSENHEFSNTTVPIKSQGNIRNAVRIGDDCWVGAGAKILAGVTIGHGSIIAAGAVVTKSFEPYSVVGGVPAKIIRLRENLTSQLDHGSDV